MLELHPQLLLYQGAIFLIFFFLMWKFVYPGLVKMIDDRRQRVESMLAEAERARGEAESLRQGYESRIDEIATEADRRLRQAEEEGQRRFEELIAAGRREAQRVAENTRLQAEAEIKQAVVAAKAELADLAAAMARKVLTRSVTPELNEKLVKELAQELAGQKMEVAQ